MTRTPERQPAAGPDHLPAVAHANEAPHSSAIPLPAPQRPWPSVGWVDDFMSWFLYGHETWLVAVLKGVPLFLFVYFLMTYMPNYVYYLITVELPFLRLSNDLGFLMANAVAGGNFTLLVILAFGIQAARGRRGFGWSFIRFPSSSGSTTCWSCIPLMLFNLAGGSSGPLRLPAPGGRLRGHRGRPGRRPASTSTSSTCASPSATPRRPPGSAAIRPSARILAPPASRLVGHRRCRRRHPHRSRALGAVPARRPSCVRRLRRRPPVRRGGRGPCDGDLCHWPYAGAGGRPAWRRAASPTREPPATGTCWPPRSASSSRPCWHSPSFGPSVGWGVTS